MGQVIELVLSYDNLMKFAENALEKGDTLTCALNLNEALTKADGREQVRRVYELFVECFRMSSSVTAVMQAIMKEIENRVDDDYYRFDFANRKKAYLPEDEEEPDYETIRVCNDVKNKIVERKYEEAMLLLTAVQPTSELCEGIIDALNDAVDMDKGINIDKYLLHVLAIMTASSSKVEILRLMLRGGQVTHRMMTESADFLLDDDDSNALCLIGMAFFENNETQIAKRFFKKALSIDPIDEDALYYMTVIKILTKDENDKTDYWSRYKQVYKITEPPIRTMEEFFKSDDVNALVPYRVFPGKFVSEKLTVLALAASGKEDITPDYAADFIEFCKCASEHASYFLIDILGKTDDKPVLTETYKKLLTSARVPDGLKEKIVDALIESGYEGVLSILTEERAVVMRVTKLHKRVHKIWNMLYQMILKNSPFCEEYLPINCGDLAYIIKKLDGIIQPDEDDINFCLALTVINYIKRLKINRDYFSALKALDLDTTDLDRGLKKFELDDIFIQ